VCNTHRNMQTVSELVPVSEIRFCSLKVFNYFGTNIKLSPRNHVFQLHYYNLTFRNRI
jgi:hypothetical protein